MSRFPRGVLYLVWGERHQAWVQRSINSVRQFYPDLPIQVHTLPAEASLLEKATMFDISPFEETLFLDADTVVLDRLDFGFERAAQFGLACCICECPWARRFGGVSGEVVEYNTGVLFFTRAAQPVFDSWRHWAARLDSSVRYIGRSGGMEMMLANDQASFAQAIAETRFNPYVLPLNWNFRPSWQHTFFGPLKIWHDYADVHPAIYQHNPDQRGEQKIINFYKIK
jgi:hypothetical protein